MELEKKNYRVTSICIEPRTDIWIKYKGIKPTFIINNAPEWYDRMMEQGEELKVLREFKMKADIKLHRLLEENVDLLRFRNKVLEKMRKKEVSE